MEELYPRLKKDLLDEIEQMRRHYGSIFGDTEFQRLYGVGIDEFIITETIKAIGSLKLKCFGDNHQYHVWIGINPPPGTCTMLQLYEKVKKELEPYSWFADAKWCVEGHTAGGYRPHIHMMVLDKKCKPVRLIEQISKKLKLEKQCIEAKSYTKGKGYQEHLRYLRGEKKEEKIENTEKDYQERELNQIPQII